VATSSLLSSGKLSLCKVVGSVNTAEFVVAVAASIGFLLTLSGAGWCGRCRPGCWAPRPVG